MDDVDIAQLRETEEREQALAAAVNRVVELPMNDDTGARICLDCFDRIPHKRLLAAPKCVRCVDCQAIHERGRL